MQSAELFEEWSGHDFTQSDVLCDACAAVTLKPYDYGNFFAETCIGTVASLRFNIKCPRCRFVWRITNNHWKEVESEGSHHPDYDQGQTIPIEEKAAVQDMSSGLKPNKFVCRSDDRVFVKYEYNSAGKPYYGLSIEVRIHSNKLLVHCSEEPPPPPGPKQRYETAYRGPVHAECADISLVKNWLHQCETEHYQCLRPSIKVGSAPKNDPEESTKFNELNLSFIDVKLRLLVRPKRRVRYLTLSYVWGSAGTDYSKIQVPYSRDSQERDDVSPEILELQPVALLESKLPQTLADAITFTEALGERYIWIDALSIPQDNPSLKKIQIDAMDIVYQESFCTLVALLGDSSSAGLPGSSASSIRSPDQNCERLFLKNTSKVYQGLEDIDKVLSESPWITRGWTFQESLLSTRTLLFTPKQVYFQCLQARSSEDIGSGSPLFSMHTPRLFHGIPSLHRLIMDRPPTSSRRQYNEKGGSRFNRLGYNPEASPQYKDWVKWKRRQRSPDLPHEESVRWTYPTLAELYAERKVGFADDALNAFRGVLRCLKDVLKTEFFHGLPLALLGAALLWREKADQTGQPEQKVWKPRGWEEATWASWSWIGHWTRIEYKHLGSWEDLYESKGSNKDYGPVLPVFSMRNADGQDAIPVENFGGDFNTPSARQGFSPTKVEIVHLHIRALTYEVSLEGWNPTAHGIFTQSNINGVITFDAYHRGMPLDLPTSKTQIYLVATTLATSRFGFDVESLKEEWCGYFMLVIMRGDFAARIGTGTMNKDHFCEESSWREFLMI